MPLSCCLFLAVLTSLSSHADASCMLAAAALCACRSNACAVRRFLQPLRMLECQRTHRTRTGKVNRLPHLNHLPLGFEHATGH